MITQVSDAELEIMKIIWENGDTAFYAYIMEKLISTQHTWQKNTVVTLLSRLMEKGLLKATKLGRRNEYTAIVSEADYLAEQTKSFLEKLYEGDAKGLVSTLIQRDMLSLQDVAELRKMWESGGQK